MTDNDFGASGKFPDGVISRSDEGELKLGITYDQTKDLVIINFGKPVAWLGLKPAQAAQFAQLILKNSTRRI